MAKGWALLGGKEGGRAEWWRDTELGEGIGRDVEESWDLRGSIRAGQTCWEGKTWDKSQERN